MSCKDGGPAFPSKQMKNENGTWFGYDHAGMTLRDYFAAQALNGILACRYGQSFRYGNDDMVKDACAFADAMIAEREK